MTIVVYCESNVRERHRHNVYTLNEIYGVQNHEAGKVFNDINLSFTLGDTSAKKKAILQCVVSWRLNAARRFDDIFHQLKYFQFQLCLEYSNIS